MQQSDIQIPWGPTGETVYNRTYSNVKPNGERETYPETVERVVTGNLSLVYGPRETWSEGVQREHDEFVALMLRFGVLPAGRHLSKSGVKGRQFLFNCHVSGWGEKLSDHFEFTFMRLMEGGGVGANYSATHLAPYGAPRRWLNMHVVCDPVHPDYDKMVDAGLLSNEFSHEWTGAFPVEDSREGWAEAMVDLFDTFMTDGEVRHPDRVYDVSRVRFEGAPLRTMGGTASGPKPFAQMLHDIAAVLNGAHARSVAPAIEEELPYWALAPVVSGPALTSLEAMQLDHHEAECVVSGGNRRSARMAIVHWRDPHIFEFLLCKLDKSQHWTTNVSVEIDQEFLDALNDAGHWLHEHAVDVHQQVVAGMLTNGEPGYWNSTYSNEGEPNRVIATNPCGEIALESWENCNLGHVNLDAFAPTRAGGPVDILGLIQAHRLVTRFLIRATYGDVTDEKQAAILARNRRIGVGHLGAQGFLAKKGIRYSEAPRNKWFRRELRTWKRIVREAARDYAFELRIPEPVKVTTVAPTGSTAKLPGVTEGIHAIYSRFFNRGVRFNVNSPHEVAMVNDAFAKGLRVEECVYDRSGNTMFVVFPTKDKLLAEVEAMGLDPDIVESQDQLTLDQLLAFQAMYQEEYADNAVSFTANVPAESWQQEHMLADPSGMQPMPAPSPERLVEVADTIARWLPKLKGTTLMLDGSRPQAPYERITEAEYLAAAFQSVEDGTDEECASGACPVV